MSSGVSFYFDKFEARTPYVPTSRIPAVAFLFKLVGLITIALGICYLFYRWMFTLNPDSLLFSSLLCVAETLSFIGTGLMVFSFWDYKDPVPQKPVQMLSEIQHLNGKPDRPIKIDIYITTYNEDYELVRLSIWDTKKLNYPFHDVKIAIYLLDDGRRDGRFKDSPNFKLMAEEEGIGYLTREDNEGFKAGNLANGLFSSDGDLLVVLDADTRVYNSLLVNTTGYFRNRHLAWVQTPQWFYDLTEKETLANYISRLFNLRNKGLMNFLSNVMGWISVNEDIFGNDTRLFYDIILRKRNRYNASFCCGAGSIHRREAVMNFALNGIRVDVENEIKHFGKSNKSVDEIRDNLLSFFRKLMIKPFAHHASEDICTSVLMHSNPGIKWESLLHPKVECKMLSTQDIHSRSKQYQRYAEGTIDIGVKKHYMFNKGLTLSQRLCYLSTLWSYLAPLWTVIFILSPIYYFFTLQTPLLNYSYNFTTLFVLLQIFNTLSFTLGTWGISNVRSNQYYISGFWYMLKAIFKAIFSDKLKFNVTPKERVNRSFILDILPHLFLLLLGLSGFLYNLKLFVCHEHPDVKAFFINSVWCLFNLFPFIVLINAGIYQSKTCD